jgi:hypothetical protein
MKAARLYIPFLVAALVVAGIAGTTRAEQSHKTEAQLIESLISTVENLKDATFLRNGTEYGCKAAADHMRSKWKWKHDEIKTARDFIRVVASTSSETGRPYMIRFKGGREVTAKDFLTAELDKLETR